MYRINSIRYGTLYYKHAVFGGAYRGDKVLSFQVQDLTTLDYSEMTSDQIYALAINDEISFTVRVKKCIIVSIALEKSAVIANNLQYWGSKLYDKECCPDRDIDKMLCVNSTDSNMIVNLMAGVFNISTLPVGVLGSNEVIPLDLSGYKTADLYALDSPEVLSLSVLDFISVFPNMFLFRDGMMYIKLLDDDSSKWQIHCWKVLNNKILLELV